MIKTETIKAAGWWLIYPWPGRADLLLYCPLHTAAAQELWQTED